MVSEHSKDVKVVLSELKVSDSKGLSSSEVEKRLGSFGKNELVQKSKVSPLKIFFSQFKSFIIYILLFAVIVSFIAKEYVDASVILAILLFNSFFGFLQEFKAEKAIDALKKLSGLKAQVTRDSKLQSVDAETLVPGDIIHLEAGSKVPADARIIETLGLEVSEASLTGESVPVQKFSKKLSKKEAIVQMKNMLFSGTVVTKGRARAVVVRTGMQTQIGKIARMVSESKTELTPLQKNLESFGRWVGTVTLGICFAIFLVGISKDGLWGYLFAGDLLGFVIAAKTWFLTAVSLAVAAVPEGLPIVVTIALAIGTRKMLRKNALIRKLHSVETLGETNVICTDKTGTLTRNEMTVRKVFVNGREIEFSGEGYSLEGRPNKKVSSEGLLLFRAGVVCNDSKLERVDGKYIPHGDPTEVAFFVSASKAGLDFEQVSKDEKVIDEVPFDSNRKLMSVVSKNSKEKLTRVFMKGAPEMVLDKCDQVLLNGKVVSLTAAYKKKLLAKNDEFASNALRVLGFAYKLYDGKKKFVEEKLIFIGMQAMIDPPHKEVKFALEKCRSAGIRVVMMTGDNLLTAKAIGSEIGLKGAAMRGSDFAKLSSKEKLRAVSKTAIFARVEPEHKLEIVKLLQETGAIVAMTGDGVNDAPAIKHANLGIAMGISGSDVTKESSEMILQDDNFVSIVDAVEEGRGIYANIRKFVNYLFSSNLAEVMIIFFAIMFGWSLPLTAVMLLWINLVTDGLPALALSVDPSPKGLMNQPPRKSSEGIMTSSMLVSILYVSVLITVAVLYLFWFVGRGQGLVEAQTVAFTALIVLEMVRLQSIRSESKIGIFSNKSLVAAVLTSLLLQLVVLYTPFSKLFGTVPLSGYDWVLIFGASMAVWSLNSLGNVVIKRFLRTPLS